MLIPAFYLLFSQVALRNPEVSSTELLPGFSDHNRRNRHSAESEKYCGSGCEGSRGLPEDAHSKCCEYTQTQFRESLIGEDILNYKKDNGFFIPPEAAERIFSNAGIDASARVIVYDSIAFPDASIIWALLKYRGMTMCRY